MQQRGLPAPGDVIAQKYVISRLVGRGGMGAVYVVEHRVTGKKLAVKCLLPEYLEHPEYIERFLREAQAAGRIEHRNVVDVFDVGREGELLYIVMELLHGKPFSHLLREGQLSLEEVLQILIRAMDGVAAAHAVGITHRDLKPDNIFVCVGQSGQLDDPRVLDFGIARLEDDLSKPLTKSGVMLGTPYYMAFEQLNSQRDLDHRVDVYAMGVILYEACAGQTPYVAESIGALAISMMSGPPVPLGQLRPELAPGLADIVMRSIARDRNQRYPTMRALIDALKPYVPESANLLTAKGAGTPLGVSVRSARAIDPTLPAMPSPLPMSGAGIDSSARLRLHATDQHSERHVRASSSRTLIWVGLGALLLIIAGVSVMLSLRRTDTPTNEVASEPLTTPAPAPAPEPAPAAVAPIAAQPAPTAPPEPQPVEAPAPADVAPPPVVAPPVVAAPTVATPAPVTTPARETRASRRGRRRSAQEQLDELARPLPDAPVATPAAPPAATAIDPATGAQTITTPADAPAAPPPATEPPATPSPAENVTPTPTPTPSAPSTPETPSSESAASP